MLIPLEKKDNILNSKPFVAEEVRFNLVYRISEDNTALLLRREDNRAIIAQSGPEFPVWVWSDDSLTLDEQSELAEDFYQLFCDRVKLSLVAKPAIAELLAKDYARRRNLSWKVSKFMESYHCPKIKIPQRFSGEICKPSFDDVAIIASFLVGFIRDALNERTTIEKQLDTAKKYIQRDNLYIWRIGNEIVSMANVAHRTPRHASINQVYTPLQNRKKGYASALIATLSRNIINEGRIPMLYADLLNPDSNKVYKSIGYIACGKVSEIIFECLGQKDL